MKHTIHISSALIYGVFGLSLSGITQAVPEDLVETLGNEDFEQREDAEKKLSAWAKGRGKKTFNELETMKKKVRSPEVKMRLGNVMDSMTIYEPIPNTRGYIGISMNARLGGVIINLVQPKTPAEKHGLLVNDIITGIDDIDLTEKNTHFNEAMDFLRAYVKTKNSGSKLTLKLLRDGKEMTKELKLADYDKAQTNGVPLNQFQQQQFQQQQFFNQQPQVLPLPNAGGKLQLKLQGRGGDEELLKMQIETQEMLKLMLEKQLGVQPQGKGQEGAVEGLKKLMLKRQKEQLELMQKELQKFNQKELLKKEK